MYSSIQLSPLRLVIVTFGLFAAAASPVLAAGPVSQTSDVGRRAEVAANYGRLPLSFEANRGQVDRRSRFVARGRSYTLFLTDSAAVLSLRKPTAAFGGRGAAPASDVVRMTLAGARGGTQLAGEEQLPGTANYFLGTDPAKWRTDVPTYAKVRYRGVYPGIDLVYYGTQGRLEYDFVVAAGRDTNRIRLRLEGAERLVLTGGGDLRIEAADGEIAFEKPVVYQLSKGRREVVRGEFRLLGRNEVGFTIGRYDRANTLVIDPVLSYSTYLGGSSYDTAAAIAVDASGDAYVTGYTKSTDYPVTKGAYQAKLNGPAFNYAGAFVAKFNAAGTALLYSTYLGGSSTFSTSGAGIAVDSHGDAYITGTTGPSFPVTAGAFQPTYKPTSASPQGSAFVTELNATGTALVYSSFLGGTINDGGTAIAVDGAGNAYITGSAESTDFPVTKGAFQTVNNGGVGNYVSNAFVAKVNTTGSALVYSTYLGGSGSGGFPAFGDEGGGIAVDGSGDVYVAGTAASPNFPVTKGAYQTVTNDPGYSNVFVSKLNPTGSALVFSTYLGGNGGDAGSGIAEDKTGVYVTGQAFSDNFPVTSGAFQTANNAAGNANGNAFITKFNPTGTAVIYSTYLGGSGPNGFGDWANAIAVDSSGDAYVTGQTISEDFPVTKDAFQSVNNDAANLGTNLFVTKINPTGTALLYSTYLGGDGSGGGNGMDDYGTGIAVDSAGSAYVTGQSYSDNFPVTAGAFQTINHAYQNGNAIGVNAVVAKFAIGSETTTLATTTTLTSSANPAVAGGPVTFSADVSPASGSGTPAGNVVFSVDGKSAATVALSGGKATYSTSSLAVGQHTILASYGGSSTYATSSDSITETINGAGTITATPGSLSFPDTGVGSSSAAKIVTVANSGSAVVTLSSISLTGSGASSYTKTTTCGTSLAAGVSCTVSAIFKPASAGSLSATLTVASSATNSPAVITLVGDGAPAGTIVITADANTYAFNTAQGTIYVELQPDSAPKNVANFLSYVKSGAYKNSLIHRLVSQFVFQGGGYYLDSSDQVSAVPANAPVANEFKLSNVRGTLAMALTGTNINSATNQFFFNLVDNSAELDSQKYTVIGKVVDVTGYPADSLAVMDTIGADPVYDLSGSLGPAFGELPLLKYTSPNAVQPSNLVLVDSITQVAPSAPTGLQFVAITPCRIADTRNGSGPFGGPEVGAGATRTFDIPQSGCNIPTAAVAYSLNVTVIPQKSLDYLTMWPAGEAQPDVSTLNSDGRIKANAAITPAGANGGVSVYASDATQVILDVDGYFVSAGAASALAFYPVTPCRVADTRQGTGPLGGPSMAAGSSRAFPILSSACGIPSTAKAYSLNVTAVPANKLDYLTTWTTGAPQPDVSTLNSSTGAIAANAAIVPAASDGDISVFVSDAANVILDINGYFAAPSSKGLSLYTVTPCRALDTRSLNGAFNGTLPVGIEGSDCAPPSTAKAYVLNATVVPPGPLDYLSLWPNGEAQPVVSTLNAIDGAVTSNMAIVPTTNGSVDAFSSNATNLILDISSYFAP